jgi:hypothetical protein
MRLLSRESSPILLDCAGGSWMREDLSQVLFHGQVEVPARGSGTLPEAT